MMCGIASSFRMCDRSTFKVRLKAESYWQWILLVLLVGLCLEVAANRPPRFLINGQTEIVLRLKEGAETPVGKTNPSLPDKDLNLNHPILGSLDQHENIALTNYATDSHLVDSTRYQDVAKSIAETRLIIPNLGQTSEERNQPRSLIYRLHGADPDGDPLVFGVREQVGNDLLRIENLGTNEANVYLKQELDRELKDEYSLVLTLTDGHLGEGNFITQSLLLLVEDVNDNEPVFKPYQPTIVVPENSPPGVLTTVEATDQDEGPYGQIGFGPVTKQLGFGPVTKQLGLSPVTKQLGFGPVTKQLAFGPVTHQLGFGSPISLGSALLPNSLLSALLYISWIQHCYPSARVRIFHQLGLGPVTKKLRRVENHLETPRSPDRDSNLDLPVIGSLAQCETIALDNYATKVLYFLQELDGDDDLFSVSTVNGKGVIRLTGQLDYERKFIYQLRVLAVDRANNNRVNTGTAAIVVKVQDVEDQPPEFVVASPVTRVSEDAAIGTPVLQVKAVDGDRGINNRIVYSITQGSQGSFEIDADSGVVFTQQKLDRESSTNNNGAYILEITLFLTLMPTLTRLEPTQLSGNNVLKILGYGERLQRLCFAGANVFGYLASGDLLGPVLPLSLLPAGHLVTYWDLSYHCHIARIDEGMKRCWVHPTEIRTSISPSFSSLAQHETSAIANYATEAQEETQSTFPPPIVKTEVTVIVTDVNDEIPTFRSPSYIGVINENAQVNTPVAFLDGAVPEVFDHDQGTNGTFVMFIDGDHGVFDVTPHKGVNEASFLIRVKDSSKLDFEKVSTMNFTLIAREAIAQNAKYSLVPVTVHIKDMNDNFPEFTKPLYEVSVLENSNAGTTVAWVQAMDEDSGNFGTQGIRYTNLGGSVSDLLYLNPNTGVITIKSIEPAFDRELMSRHYLTVEARDDSGDGNRELGRIKMALRQVYLPRKDLTWSCGNRFWQN
uniref:(California timema) hypothetical protein n=1 Tax=Timema californicum TaxID=61474 RepID=A0A7R9J486_TIMCA|nr:unnamed protein product [Timema californicum]